MLERSLQSNRIYYTSVYKGCVVLLVTGELNLMCKISVLPLSIVALIVVLALVWLF